MSFSWYGVPGLLALIAALGAAIIALRTAPGRTLNQRLATVLVLDAMFTGIGSGLIFFIESRSAVEVLIWFSAAAQAALSFQYLAFLGAALETPLVRPFRSKTAWLMLTLASAAGVLAMLVMPERFYSEPYHPGWGTWNYQLVDLGEIITQMNGASAVFGLVAAIATWLHTAPGSAARIRAKWFVLAFGVRDLFAVSLGMVYPILRPVPFWGEFLYNPFQSLAAFIYILLLAYGVLHTQVLGIELTIKVAIQRSTVLAAVAASFLVVSELIEILIPVDGKVVGMITALGIVLALRPVERIAKRLADRLMPDVSDTPDYREARRLEVYRAALESATQDGVITEREHAILARLRVELEIPADKALHAERDFSFARNHPARMEGAT